MVTLLNDHRDVMAAWKTDYKGGNSERKEKGQEGLAIIPGRCQKLMPGRKPWIM